MRLKSAAFIVTDSAVQHSGVHHYSAEYYAVRPLTTKVTKYREGGTSSRVGLLRLKSRNGMLTVRGLHP